MIFSAKTQSNPESSVGLMSMGGKGPEMLVTLTTDFGKVLDGMHRTKIRGNAHLATGLQIAAVRLFSILLNMLSGIDDMTTLACAQTPAKQLSKATHHCFHLFGHTRRGERAGQTGEEAEEGQHFGRYRCFRRPGSRQYEEVRGLHPGGQLRGRVTSRSYPTGTQPTE